MSVPEMKVIHPLAGGGGAARVELVRVGERLFVRKTHRLRNIAGEVLFQQGLRAHGLPCLAIEHHPDIRADQVLLEYVPGSPTIGGSPTPDVCARWGAAVGAVHSIQAARFETVDESGRLVEGDWAEFVKASIRRALDGQRHRESDLPTQILDRAEDRLNSLLSFCPRSFVLTHGDLHVNNALLRGDDVVLFDKASEVWVAPAVFDLCLIFSEAFPGARFGAARDGDPERLNAFLAGYGPLPPDQEKWIDHFVLLRALRRYPNPFVPELRAIIERVSAGLAA
jgi:Ser/Thr protein kinase RdoA (MazF antagonist)